MLVIIPARLGSTRLPNKPLAEIGGEPMIVHVWRRAVEADVGDVWVATDDTSIAGQIQSRGGYTVFTGAECASGSDRAAQAAALIGMLHPNWHGHVLNVQGDMPFVSPDLIRQVSSALRATSADMVTAAHTSDVVEVVNGDFKRRTMAKHIGIYGFQRDALERFASLPQSPREIGERLEQLRAVDAGMKVEVVASDTFPFEVNTPADLVVAQEMARYVRA